MKRIKRSSIARTTSLLRSGAPAVLFLASPAFADTAPPPLDTQWQAWVQSQTERAEPAAPAVQNRVVDPSSRFELAGPLGGISSRDDFYNNYLLSAALRYHFTETQGWELLKIDFDFFSESPLAQEIREQTSFHPDAQTSRLQLSSGYYYSPIFGKYAWGTDNLIHFDVYGVVGPGLRFTTSGATEVFAFGGIGMNHFVFSDHLSIVPQFTLRSYSEQRSGSTLVWESIFQIGTSWLL